MPDFYKILGVDKKASDSELKSAYRKLAKEYHPDRNQGNEEAEKKFKEINAAYEILKDSQKRAAYDRYGDAAFTNGAGGSGGGPGGMGGFNFNGSFSDIFEDLFSNFSSGGGRSHRQEMNRGSDLRYNFEVSLEEAFKGEKKKIKIPTMSSCETCKGTGSADKSNPATCNTCNGAGKIRSVQGFFTVERTCGTCGGHGSVIKNKCKKCKGDGRVKQEKTLSVTIPAGVEEGTRIRLAGEGEAGLNGGESGDLYIFISIKEHPIFMREGNDLHCKVPIPMTTAALGGGVEVPTIEGSKVRVNIAEGAQTGDKFRLSSKGMSSMRSSGRRGNMYVHAMVETPKNLSKKQKEILQEFDKISGKNSHQPETAGFAKRMKDFLK